MDRTYKRQCIVISRFLVRFKNSGFFSGSSQAGWSVFRGRMGPAGGWLDMPVIHCFGVPQKPYLFYNNACKSHITFSNEKEKKGIFKIIIDHIMCFASCVISNPFRIFTTYPDEELNACNEFQHIQICFPQIYPG